MDVLARFLTSSQVYRNLDLNSLTTFLCLKSICNSLSKTAALSHWQNANYPHPYCLASGCNWWSLRSYLNALLMVSSRQNSIFKKIQGKTSPPLQLTTDILFFRGMLISVSVVCHPKKPEFSLSASKCKWTDSKCTFCFPSCLRNHLLNVDS